MKRSIILTAAVGVLTVVASMGSTAAADTGSWHQSFQRSSADEACVAPTWESPWQDSFSGQREWTPSWAQWPNGGTGGWVCNRTVVWADIITSNCQLLRTRDGTAYYGQFGGGWAILDGAPEYSDPSCSTASGTSVRGYIVLASSADQADARCDAVDPLYPSGVADVSFFNSALWLCNPFG